MSCNKSSVLSDYIVDTIDNRGKNPSQYLYQKTNHPVIDNFLIKNELFPDMSAVTRYIDDDTYQNFLRGYVHKNMPIMTLVGNGIGNVSLAPDENVAIIQNTIGFLCDEEKMNEVFLYYYLIAKQDVIRKFDRGSGQPSIRKTDILSMSVSIPELEIQKKIAHILYSIDQKIDINKQINDNFRRFAA